MVWSVRETIVARCVNLIKKEISNVVCDKNVAIEVKGILDLENLSQRKSLFVVICRVELVAYGS